MNNPDVLSLRLRNQRLASAPFVKPEEVVQWLGAVQSQDYAGAKWSVGQRAGNGTDADVEEAFNAGRMLRTHMLRPTWHFVTPADIRWILMLTAPRVKALSASQYRKADLDDALFARCQTLIAEALRGGKQRTRLELADVLGREGIVADKLRLSLIMMHAELDGIICSGAVRGKQHTYALLEERAPNAKTLTRGEALAELAGRFFTSHGPASLNDYMRWSGLSAGDAKQGLAMVQQGLLPEVREGQTYWFSPSGPTSTSMPMTAYLLPEYDECVLTYKDLSFPDMPQANAMDRWNDIFYRPVIIDGKRAGTWRRMVAKGAVIVELNLFAELNAAERQALQDAIERYGKFVNMPVTSIFQRCAQ